MDFFLNKLKNILLNAGVKDSIADWSSILVLVAISLSIIFLLDFVIRKIIRSIFSKISYRTKTDFDDIMINHKVPRNIAHIIPIVLTYNIVPNIFYKHLNLKLFLEKLILVSVVVSVVWAIRSIFKSIKIFFKSIDKLRDKPIDSYIQVLMIFIWLTGIFGILAIVTGISFWEFMAGIGTVSAVIILVFKDTILGFVASIQVSVNDMVRIGDWITFEKYGADGDVIEINLATVKVKNFDHTITTIPTYALISDSFKNWRGMTESKGRRIKRSLNIRISSIRHLNDSDIKKMSKIDLIKKYIEDKYEEIIDHNKTSFSDKSLLINGRNLTNIGVFRKYIECFVENHSAINKDLMIMARQLEPGENGLPIQIYAFSNDKKWQNFEYIIADIFDHLIASAPTFDLEIHENEFKG